jgi:hypothetical protein
MHADTEELHREDLGGILCDDLCASVSLWWTLET